MKRSAFNRLVGSATLIIVECSIISFSLLFCPVERLENKLSRALTALTLLLIYSQGELRRLRNSEAINRQFLSREGS